MSLIEAAPSSTLSIEEICLNLDKLKKDYEITTKACSKAAKDKARFTSLLEQHQNDIQQTKAFIEQQIQHRAHLEQRTVELEWKLKMKDNELLHVQSLMQEEQKQTEETCNKCDSSLDQLSLKAEEYNTKLQRSNKMKQLMLEETISLRNTFSEMNERKKNMQQQLKDLEESTSHIQDTLYELDDQLSAIMRTNAEKLKDTQRERMDQLLLAEQQQCNEQMKLINLELRDLRQRKHNLTQQVESKKKLRDALQDELQHLSQEMKQIRKPLEKNICSEENVVSSDANSNQVNLTNPFSTHFASNSNKLEPRRQFTFKKQVRNESNSGSNNNANSLAPSISPVTPDVRLLKRKSSNQEDHNQLQSANQKPLTTPKKNEFRTAKEILQSKPLSTAHSLQASPSTYTFKKTKKD
ncbi:hypothetical protein C9374_007650 [Naegleria lovaniensis]|uniref:Uncharacterized protein n=1 Tax=Naegleria lovaniensis TaxID=51637 RepID=A0AA88GGH6_NAELO|nr:uncharacterized protein C9374_007650 [Naegleria lovaniensis]KAG2379012.1 hypothetical protein C9374_007650 [Naegleria lovaniensis]